jgi:hypothetical protein
MPKRIYYGDPVAVRYVTINLINRGELSVDPDFAKKRGLGEKGKYYFENVGRGKWYSKYGILNTLMYVPPLLLDKFYHGELKLDNYAKHPMPLNLYNIFLSLIIAVFLFRIMSEYTHSSLVMVAFVLTAFYSCYLWYYLRAQSFEIFQLLFFTIHYYYLVRFRTKVSRITSNCGSYAFVSLLLSNISLVLLCLTKVVYVLVMPISLAFAFLAIYRHACKSANHSVGLSRDEWRGYCIFGLLPVVLGGLAILWINNYKFGSPLHTGYQQWVQEKNLFGGTLLEGICGFLFSPQWSIFIHFPLLVYSLFGLKRFWVRHRFDISFLYVTFAVILFVNSKFVNWKGEWCYGPRYMLFVLPVLSLPFVTILEGLMKSRKRKGFGSAVRILLVAVPLCLSLLLQINVNSLNFFAYYRVKPLFDDVRLRGESLERERALTEIKRYFGRRHFGLINRDLMDFKYRNRPFYPFERLRPLISERTYEILEYLIKRRIKTNYYWF